MSIWYAIDKKTKVHRIAGDGAPRAVIGFYCGEVLVQADADGWIPWEGEECPLPPESECDVKTYYSRTTGCVAAGVAWENIVAYRPRLTKPEAPEWDGGLPPVGIECEVELESNEWQWCEIKAHRGSGSWIVTSIEDRVIRNDLVRFRPIRSEEEKAIDEMIAAVNLIPDIHRTICRDIYRAIKSGELKI